MTNAFWDAIDAQLQELTSATSADDVLNVLSLQRSPLGDPGVADSAADGFFAGSGGDGTVRDSLRQGGWATLWSQAGYHYAIEAPDGSRITYIQGDIYRGDRRAAR